MPSDKLELERKWELIDKAKQLLDLLYSAADAKKDTAIQQFRQAVLQQLDQLKNTNYEDEIKILTEFNNQLISILIEAGNQTIQLKDNVCNEMHNVFNINSNNLAHENAEFNFGKNEINFYHITKHNHFNHYENKTEQPALNDQKKSLALLYERFSSFYKAQRVKRTFGESEEGEAFDDLYTRLALIREREVKEDREHCRKDLISLKQMSADRIARDEHLHLFEHILYTERKPIEEDQLFLPVADDVAALRHKSRIDRLLIRGQAGVGKTTFCYHLARTLIAKNHWVFVIPLRYLWDVNEKLTDVDVITQALEIELTQEEIALLLQLLTDKTQTVYWLLDGYDEVAALPKTHPVQQWLIKAFHKEQVIVTTRPREVKEFVAERQIEMIGYLPEDVEKYVTRYFGKQHKKRESFMAFVKQQKQLGAIHRIPIILELMCWVWHDLTMEQGVNTIALSFTDLYVHVLQGLNRRYLMRNPEHQFLARDGTDEEIEKQLANSYLDPLLELAYQTFVANQFIFTGREVARYLLQVSSDARRTMLYELGLVRCLRDAGTFDRNEFSFIHLTAQEFLMAKRWVQLFTSKAPKDITRAVSLLTGRKTNGEWIDCHKYDKRLEVVWGFVAGLLKDQLDHLQRFLDLIAGAPRDQIGARHLGLLLQVVGEASCLNEDTREYEEIAAWLSKEDYRWCGLGDYAPILARYPAVVRVLQKEWDKLWAGGKGERNRKLVIELLSWVRLDEKGKIYSDLVRALETDIERDAVEALGKILLTEAQQEEVIALLCNRLQEKAVAGKAFQAVDIMRALESIYSRRPFSPGFPSNLFASLFAYIEKTDNEIIVHAVWALGRMELSEEKHLSILDTLLARLRQTQFESSNAIKYYTAQALGYIPIPEKRQAEITRLLLDMANDKSDLESQGSALEALSEMNPPEALRWEVIDTFLNHWGNIDFLSYTLRSISQIAEAGLRRIFILLNEQDQEQVMETLLTHLKGIHHEKKCASLLVLQGMKIPTSYQASVLEALLWNGLHDCDDEVKGCAARALIGMDIPEAMQPQFIDALIDALPDDGTKAKTLVAIPIPEQLKTKVIDALFKKFSQANSYYAADFFVRSLGRIGIPQELSKKIMEISYILGSDAFIYGSHAFCGLNSYCLILDDDLPCYLREVLHTFVFYSADAKSVHLAGTFNNWLKASNGKINFWQHKNWEMRECRRWRWELPIRLLPGSYEFNYVIDEGRRWEHNPNYPLSVNGHSELKIEPAAHRTNEPNRNNASPLTPSNSADSHAQVLSRLRSNSNNTSTMTASYLPSKQTIDNEIALSDAEEPETDSTNASEEEDATADMTHTIGW